MSETEARHLLAQEEDGSKLHPLSLPREVTLLFLKPRELLLRPRLFTGNLKGERSDTKHSERSA